MFYGRGFSGISGNAKETRTIWVNLMGKVFGRNWNCFGIITQFLNLLNWNKWQIKVRWAYFPILQKLKRYYAFFWFWSSNVSVWQKENLAKKFKATFLFFLLLYPTLLAVRGYIKFVQIYATPRGTWKHLYLLSTDSESLSDKQAYSLFDREVCLSVRPTMFLSST